MQKVDQESAREGDQKQFHKSERSPESSCNSTNPTYPDSTEKLVRIGACGPTGRDNSREDDPTIVRVRVPEGRRPWLNFMIDIGAAVNLIKIGALDRGALVDMNQVIPLIGISDQTVNTLGTTILTIKGNPVMFLVTHDNFS